MICHIIIIVMLSECHYVLCLNIKIEPDMNDNNDIIISEIRLAGRGGLAGEADRWVAQGYARGAARSKRMGDQVLRLRMSTGTATDRVLRLFDCSHSFLLDRIPSSSETTARP